MALQRRSFAALSTVALSGLIYAFAATPDASVTAMPEVDAATLGSINRGLAPVGPGPVNAEVTVGTLFETDFAVFDSDVGLMWAACLVVGGCCTAGCCAQSSVAPPC